MNADMSAEVEVQRETLSASLKRALHTTYSSIKPPSATAAGQCVNIQSLSFQEVSNAERGIHEILT